MYCSRCNVLLDGDVCPHCGNKKTRAPLDEDLCFLTGQDVIWGEMLADVLKQNHIPFFQKSALGAGMAMKVGPYLDRYSFYVPYSYLRDAKDIVDFLFASPQE